MRPQLSAIQLITTIVVFIVLGCNRHNKNQLPEIKLISPTGDSIDIDKETNGRIVMLMYFNPDCEYCEEEVRQIESNHESFEKVKIYLISLDSLWKLKSFHAQFRLDHYQFIKVGQDYKGTFFKYAMPSTTPYILLFDKKNILKVVYRGATQIKDVITVIKQM